MNNKKFFFLFLLLLFYFLFFFLFFLRSFRLRKIVKNKALEISAFSALINYGKNWLGVKTNFYPNNQPYLTFSPINLCQNCYLQNEFRLINCFESKTYLQKQLGKFCNWFVATEEDYLHLKDQEKCYKNAWYFRKVLCLSKN